MPGLPARLTPNSARREVLQPPNRKLGCERVQSHRAGRRTPRRSAHQRRPRGAPQCNAVTLDCDRNARGFDGSRRPWADRFFGYYCALAANKFLRVARRFESVAPTLRQETLGLRAMLGRLRGRGTRRRTPRELTNVPTKRVPNRYHFSVFPVLFST